MDGRGLGNFVCCEEKEKVMVELKMKKMIKAPG
jgi:hypothetical protein